MYVWQKCVYYANETYSVLFFWGLLVPCIHDSISFSLIESSRN